MTRPAPLIVDHDGSADDLMALLLVLTLDAYDLRAVIVTEADCYAEPTVSATRSMLRLLGRAEVPVGLSAARAVNPMPSEWRRDSWILERLPLLLALREASDDPPADGERLLTAALRAALEPATVLVTGPLSCLAAVLTAEPVLAARIARVVWMGGALRVPGNVSPFTEPGHDGSAEWNAYWDPPAVATVWASEIPLVVCPLDATDRAGLEPRVLGAALVAQRHHWLSDLAAQAYALVSHVPDYFVWDVTTAGYLAWPELYDVERLATRVSVRGASEGRIAIDAGGRELDVLAAVDADGLRGHLLEQWARS